MPHGTAADLPPSIASRVKSSDVIYWSTVTTAKGIFCTLYLESMGPAVFLPCFWPHMLVLSPCFCAAAYYNRWKLLTTAVVLTTTTLDLLDDNGTTTSIALDNIQSVTATTKSQIPCCMPDVNRIIIDDGRPRSENQSSHISLIGHDNIDEFRRLILEAKDRRLHPQVAVPMGVMPMQMIPQQVMPLGQQQPVVYGYPQTMPPAYGQVTVYPQQASLQQQQAIPTHSAYPSYSYLPSNPEPNNPPKYGEMELPKR